MGIELKKVTEKVVEGILFKPDSTGYFGVSSCGKIIGKLGKILKLRSQGHYLIVSYWPNVDGIKKPANKYVHRLVAEVWIGNLENLPEVNHKDGNKLNNSFQNLEWVDRKLNVEHAISHKLLWNFPKKGEKGFQKK